MLKVTFFILSKFITQFFKIFSFYLYNKKRKVFKKFFNSNDFGK